MPLTVLSVAYSLAPVFRDSVGGAEQILWSLDRALTRAGQRSIVIASLGSEVTGSLISIPWHARGILDERAQREAQLATRAAIERAIRCYDIDVLHMHGVDFGMTLPRASVPTLITLHLPISYYSPESLELEHANTFLNCVSRAQHETLPSNLRQVLSPIENGVDLDSIQPRSRKHRFALALGRICPEKRYSLALDAAKLAGVPLILAGQVFPYAEHVHYFETEIAPRLSPTCRFIGPVLGARKRRLLAAARCLLIPSQVPETSSLVAMEALAAGTPVIASKQGALAHYIEPGKNGFFAETAEEFAEGILRAEELSRESCRAFAERHFSVERMAREYMEVYQELSRQRQGGSPFRNKGRLFASELNSLSELETLEREWDALFDASPSTTPFQSFPWVLAWYRHMSSGRPRVVTVRSSGELVGLLPLEESSDGVLRLAGHGITDTLDMLARPSQSEEVLNASLSYIVGKDDWSRLELEELRVESPLAALLNMEERNGCNIERTLCSVCPVLELGASIDLESMLTPKIARNLKYAEHRAELASVRHEQASAETLEAHLDALFRTHRARWQERGSSGVLADEKVVAFHREASRGLLARGLLLLSSLRVEGVLRASLLAYRARDRVLYYIGGFEPEAARFSPIVLLLAATLRRSLGEGIKRLDFLRGCEPYKYDWGARNVQQFGARLTRPRARISANLQSGRTDPIPRQSESV